MHGGLSDPEHGHVHQIAYLLESWVAEARHHIGVRAFLRGPLPRGAYLIEKTR
jgi:hypothetical protein